MKRVLITGAKSYIGESFEKYCETNYPNKLEIDTLDMRDSKWKAYNFSNYDTVLHVAGIVHQKETKENAIEYYKINRDMAVETAKQAKHSGVKQFIFMSSMSVYGLNHYRGYITQDTICRPTTNYGKSKLQAEKEIAKLSDELFKVSILRPPMVHGNNSPGNLAKLYGAVRKIRLFPAIINERSSLSIEKLCSELYRYLDKELSGVFLPQDNEYMCTYQTVKQEMEKEEIHVYYTSIFNPIISMLIGKVDVITKIFGDLKYER